MDDFTNFKTNLLFLLKQYENDKEWWRLRPYEDGADFQDFASWLELLPQSTTKQKGNDV